MGNQEEIVENLSIQISELEALQSVYPKELIVSDHGILADINDFIKSPTDMIPQRLEYSIEISTDNGTVEFLVSLPVSYPKEKPEVYARSSVMNRTEQLLLNEALNDIVEQQEQEEPSIYTLITWLQDNVDNYLKSKANEEGPKEEGRNKSEKEATTFARYWIYSHHIYSKFKRRDIVELAKEHSLSGFCLAGKPGIICMEGALIDCEQCWQKIKSMNWHKILVKLMEKQADCKDVNDSRKFMDFQEISFPSSERHNDMGLLLKYLTEHNLQYAFKELFGFEGKYSEVPG